MEKKLIGVAYWIGIICAVIAILARGLALIGVFIFPISPSKIEFSYWSFLEGAVLFFVMAIASSVVTWAKAQKS